MTPLEKVQNPNTPPIGLKVLANDKDWVIRLAVANNPNTPPSSLETLAKDTSTYIRHAAVAKNPNFPPYLKFKRLTAPNNDAIL
jgi:hypothetical protein